MCGSTRLSAGIRFPHYLLPIILIHIKSQDRKTLAACRLVSHTWLYETTPFFFQKITLTYENVDLFLESVELSNPKLKDSITTTSLASSSTSEYSACGWTKYIHYIYVNSPSSYPISNVVITAASRKCYYSKVRKALNHCVNIKGVFSENRIFYQDTDSTDVIISIKPDQITHLDLNRKTMNFSPLHPSHGQSLQTISSTSPNSTEDYLPQILRNTDLFRNVRVLYLHQMLVKDPNLDYTSLRNFINLRTMIIESETYATSDIQSVPVTIISNLPPSLKSLSVQISEAALVEFCDMSPQCHIDRLQADLDQLEIRIFEQKPMYPETANLSNEFIELSRLFPTTVHLLRIFSTRDDRDYVFAYKEISETSNHSGLDVKSTFANFQHFFDSTIWSTYNDYGNLSDLNHSSYHNLVDLKFPSSASQYSLDSISTISPSLFHQRLESFSICGNASWFEVEASKVIQNMVNLSHLSLKFSFSIPGDSIPSLVRSIREGCPRLCQVLIHVSESFTSFHLILQIVEGLVQTRADGLPCPVKRVWVAGKSFDASEEWVKVAEAHGIVVEPFNDPFVGFRYPWSIHDEV
ncbi:hypothetical protein HDU76_009408 [Blyttiomyces sp. JEL0837]|nr:hypothetical protein HDU76_009408 [Blyttiomyces sp. JEL0837]